MSSIKRHDLDLHISLPADAPPGHPHIIDFSHIDEDGPTDELHAVDAIATTLYKWNPEALQSLLETKIEKFRWSRVNRQGDEHYVKRTGREICVGYLESCKRFPDYEVQYAISQDGCWQITGGREEALNGQISFQLEDRPERCTTYDRMFAMSLILNQMWMPADSICFLYEIRTKNMLAADEDQHMKEEGVRETNIKNEIVTNGRDIEDYEDCKDYKNDKNEIGISIPGPPTPTVLTDLKKHILPDTNELDDIQVKRQRTDLSPSATLEPESSKTAPLPQGLHCRSAFLPDLNTNPEDIFANSKLTPSCYCTATTNKLIPLLRETIDRLSTIENIPLMIETLDKILDGLEGMERIFNDSLAKIGTETLGIREQIGAIVQENQGLKQELKTLNEKIAERAEG